MFKKACLMIIALGLSLLSGQLLNRPLAQPTASAEQVKIKVMPQRVYLEKGRCCQLENSTSDKLELNTIQVSVYDKNNRLLTRKIINKNGLAPSIYTIPNIKINSKGSLFVFNPFYSFEADLEIKTLRYEFIFDVENSQRQYKSESIVSPSFYEPKTDLILPLKSRMIVYDGHDFYSHHRRLDLSNALARQIGLKANPSRYAYDLCIVNENGDLYKDEGRNKEDWFGYGASVYAPGDGKIVELLDNMPDNSFAGEEVSYAKEISLENSSTFAGNHIVIDHGNGEYSLVAHLKAGSIKVKQGKSVKQGQLIGRMGFSGDTAKWVHVHYELHSRANLLDAEGLPSYFRNFRRITGAQRIDAQRGQIDTGDIIESN
jgi:murein DD-endopeptidase MepM/ murein hydrolase activator NlpD